MSDSQEQPLPSAPALPDNAVALHVGVHKTGTTAIQAALADARLELKQYGVTYPGRQLAHHGPALSSLGKSWGWTGKGDRQFDEKVFDRLAAKVRTTSGRVVVSSEHFCEARQEVARKVVEGMGADRAHVIITLRNLGNLLPSSYQQYLKYGLRAKYDAWLKNTFDEADTAKRMSPSFWRRNDHGAVVEAWASAVGPERVTVVILERVPRDAVFRTFAQLLAVPEDIMVSRMNLTSNRSMTAAEAELLRRINMQVRRELTWPQYERLVRNGIARNLVEGRSPAPDEARLSTAAWALDAAAERACVAVDRIRASGVKVIGDLDALGERLPSQPEVAAPEDIPMAAVVHTINAFILQQVKPVATVQPPGVKHRLARKVARVQRAARSRGK